MKKYELHLHTYYSLCSNNKPKTILKMAKKRGLDGFAVTDHNSIRGALEVKKLNKEFDVIIGEEIKTDKGEILGYYLTKEIKPGKFEDVIKEIRRQKGIAILAHPFRLKRSSNLSKKDLALLDGIEVFNSRNFSFDNEKAKKLAKKYNLFTTCGSDAHLFWEVGKSINYFEKDLRSAVKSKKNKIKVNNRFNWFNRLLSGFIIIKNFFVRR